MSILTNEVESFKTRLSKLSGSPRSWSAPAPLVLIVSLSTPSVLGCMGLKCKVGVSFLTEEMDCNSSSDPICQLWQKKSGKSTRNYSRLLGIECKVWVSILSEEMDCYGSSDPICQP